MSSSAAAVALPKTKYIRNADGHFVCPHCGEIKEKQNTMYYHIKKNHDEDLPFVCKKCDDSPRFLQKTAYLHHLAAIHPECPTEDNEVNPYAGVEYACPFTGCSHKTHTKANTLIHFARNHSKSWIPSFSKDDGGKCSGCAKDFASSSAYLYHSVTCLRNSAPADHSRMLSKII